MNHEAIQFVTFEPWRLRVFVVKNSCRAVKELRGSSAKPGSNCALGHGRIRISTDRICVRKEKERASSTPPGEWITGWAGMKAPEPGAALRLHRRIRFFLLEHVGKKVDNMVDGGIPWR